VASNGVGESSSTCTIIEAARATSAAPLYFPTMKIGNNEFFDGALKSNNPVLELISETRGVLGNRPIKCVVSIGTGKPKESNHETSAIGAIATLRGIATDTEHPHHELMTEPAYADIRERYFRLNVENDLSNIGMERWDLLSRISENTTDYLQEHETRTTISQCAELLAS
jgi:patatin-like phospholipase/acyl hydrolase